MGTHKWLPSVAIGVGAETLVTVLRVRVLSGMFHVSGVMNSRSGRSHGKFRLHILFPERDQ